MRFDWDAIITTIVEHRGKIAGALAGLLLGWLVIRFGFWRALLVTFFIAGGIWLGAMFDNEGWGDLYDGFVRRRR